MVFVSLRTASPTTDGQLRAVSGRSGLPLFSVPDLANDLNPVATPAIGDIDGDGRPEIVAVAEQGNQLLAFEHDGTLKWRSALLEFAVGYGAPFLADLDGDGRAEIVVGRQVLNGNGTLRWTGSAPMVGRTPATGLRSVAADLDLDGRLEVIAGASAYRADGTLLWSAPAVGDGVVAIANLDSDPYPEIVVAGNNLWLLEHDGSVRWGPLVVPGSSNFGTITIADLDGDAQAEIGVGKWPVYNVVEAYGQLRWSATTASPTLVPATASAFDFDGDGAAELVMADPAGLHVLNGRDGSVAGELPVGSCSNAYAYPAVADVDGDGKAEIVMGSYPCAGSPAIGVRVFGEARDGWVRARAAWSQSEYAAPGENAWRANGAAPGASPFAAADLTASFVRRGESGSDLVLTARIGNAGVGTVNAGVPVSAYNGDPRLGYPFLATTLTTRTLAPGEFEDVVLRISSHVAAQASIVVVADDAGDQVGTIGECDEENNRHDTGLFLNQAPAVERRPGPPDLDPEPDGVAVGRGRGRRAAARRQRERALVLRRALGPEPGGAALRRPHVADDDRHVPRARGLPARDRRDRLAPHDHRIPHGHGRPGQHSPRRERGPRQDRDASPRPPSRWTARSRTTACPRGARPPRSGRSCRLRAPSPSAAPRRPPRPHSCPRPGPTSSA